MYREQRIECLLRYLVGNLGWCAECQCAFDCQFLFQCELCVVPRLMHILSPPSCDRFSHSWDGRYWIPPELENEMKAAYATSINLFAKSSLC